MIPSYQDCMLPLLKELKENGTLSYNEATKKISDWFNLSTEERSELLPSGKQTIIKNRVGWAKFYLNKAGLVNVLARGKYSISDKGISLLQRGIQSLTTDDLMNFAEFRNFITSSRGSNFTNTASSSQVSRIGSIKRIVPLEFTMNPPPPSQYSVVWSLSAKAPFPIGWV